MKRQLAIIALQSFFKVTLGLLAILTVTSVLVGCGPLDVGGITVNTPPVPTTSNGPTKPSATAFMQDPTENGSQCAIPSSIDPTQIMGESGLDEIQCNIGSANETLIDFYTIYYHYNGAVFICSYKAISYDLDESDPAIMGGIYGGITPDFSQIRTNAIALLCP